MDGSRFDRIITDIAHVSSRRRSLVALGGVLISALAPLGHREAAARCLPLDFKCERGANCCGGAECKSGSCRCTGNKTKCKRHGVCCAKDKYCCPVGSKAPCVFNYRRCCPAGSAQASCGLVEDCCPAGSAVPCADGPSGCDGT